MKLCTKPPALHWQGGSCITLTARQQPRQDSRHSLVLRMKGAVCQSSCSLLARGRRLILLPRLFLENVSALEREKGSKYEKSYSLYKGALGISIKYRWDPEWLMTRGNSNWFILLVVQCHPRTQQGDQRSAVQEATHTGTGGQKFLLTELWVCSIS